VALFKPYRFVFLAGKGGVGKSFCCANVARILSHEHRVAVVDADLEGSNTGTIFGVADVEMRLDVDGDRVLPTDVTPSLKLINVASHPALRSLKTTVVWDQKHQEDFLYQVLTRIDWGWTPDFLLVDCPAGVGMAIPALRKAYRHVDGAFLVTSPAQVSIENCEAVVNMLKDVGIPVVGIMENMSYIECQKCSHREWLFGPSRGEGLATKHGVEFFGMHPFVPGTAEKMDAGEAVKDDALVHIAQAFILHATKAKRIKGVLGWA